MSDEMIIRHGSTTLAGLKTGNLFTCSYSGKKELLDTLRSLNCRLAPKGVRIIPSLFSEKKVLLYIYIPVMLKHAFAV